MKNKIKRITKNQIKRGFLIGLKYGYWSNEVLQYQDEFYDYNKICSIMYGVFNSHQRKANKYYNLLLEVAKENNIQYQF